MFPSGKGRVPASYRAVQRHVLVLSRATTDAVVGFDPDGIISMWTAQAERLWGRQAGDVNGQPCSVLFAADQAVQVEALLGDVRDGKIVAHVPLTARDRDGRSRPIDLTLAPVVDARGALAGMTMLAREVKPVHQPATRLTDVQERIRFALEATDAGVFEWDIAGGTLRWSRNVEPLFGLPPGTFTGTLDRFLALLHTDDRRSFAETVKQAVSSGKGFALQVRTDGTTEQERWLGCRGRVFQNSHGAPASVGLIVRDVTAEHRTIMAARESEQRYRDLFEHAGDIIYILDLDGRIQDINRRVETLTGYTREELIGRSVRQIVAPEYHDVMRRARERKQDGEPVTTYELEVVRRDGSRLALEVSSRLMLRNGMPIGLQGIARDITNQRRAQERLRETNRVTETLYHIGRTLAAELDMQTLAQTVIDAAARLTGAERGLFLARLGDDEGEPVTVFAASPTSNIEAFPVPLPDPDLVFALSARRAPIRTDDVTAVPASHETGPVLALLAASGNTPRSFLAAPVISRSGVVMGGLFFGHPEPCVFRDEHERLVAGIAAQAAVALDNARLYESERRARRAAEASNEAKDEFLSVLSHELRTPLTSILGFTDLLRRRGRSDPAFVASALDTIERSARLQVRLVSDLLDMSRIVAGKLQLEMRPVVLRGVVEAAVEAIRLQAQGKGIALLTELTSDSVTVAGDPERLQQVIANLLSNAVKFTPEGGEITVRLSLEGDAAVLRVTDTGPGIDPMLLPRVFERFLQGDSSSRRVHGGLGLGLAIARHLVERHGGTVTAASLGQGYGSTFTVCLPVVQLQPIRLPDGTGGSTAEEGDLTGLRILLVEDEPDTRTFLSLLLQTEGAKVSAAPTAAAALAELERGSFDVLVADIGLPDEDGYALIRRVRARPAAAGGTIQAVALTAYAGNEDRRRAFAAGFQRHIVKPVDPAQLIGELAEMTNRMMGGRR